MTNVATLQRASTAMSIASTSSIQGNMTALPSLPTASTDDYPPHHPTTKGMPRKKSFSALRRRSESIGHAIKGLSKVNTRHDVPMPSPALMTPRRPPIDMGTFATPPLPSPHPQKDSAGSFVSMPRSTSAYIGLGLKTADQTFRRTGTDEHVM
jgi:hypothetical protein